MLPALVGHNRPVATDRFEVVCLRRLERPAGE